MAMPGIVIKIGANTKDAIDGINKVSTRLGRFGKETRSKANRAVVGIGLGAAAAGAAFVAVASDSIQAAAEQEKANKRLGKTMENLGLGEQTDAVLENVAAMQSQFGVSEDDLIPAFEKLVRVTGDSKGAFDLLRTAMDTAAGTGKPLETVTAAIAKAAGPDGATGALSKLVPELDKLSLKGGAAKVMEALNKQFSGQAQSNAETTAGTFERMSLAAGEIQESFGAGILDGFVGGDADQAVENLEDAAVNAERVGRAVGALGTNAMGWASDFILGLEAISYYTDSWAIRVTKNINGVLDTLGLISDEEGQRRTDVANGLQTRRDFEAATAVAGGGINGVGGGNLATGQAVGAGRDWGAFYGSGPRSVDPNRYKSRSDDADARATARGTKTRANP